MLKWKALSNEENKNDTTDIWCYIYQVCWIKTMIDVGKTDSQQFEMLERRPPPNTWISGIKIILIVYSLHSKI